MRRYRTFLLLGGVVVLIALALSTTSLVKNMDAVPELSLFAEDPSFYRMTPESLIQGIVQQDHLPSDWPLYVEEQAILDATNGLSGPLADDFFRAGVLRTNLQLVINETSYNGGWPALAISPDGMAVKFMSIQAYADDYGFCRITTLKYNDSRLWPRYLEVESKTLRYPPGGGPIE